MEGNIGKICIQISAKSYKRYFYIFHP